MQPILCVDFGTTTTQAALVTAAGVQLLHDPASGSTGWPSVVYADGERLLVGRAAEKRKRARPANFRAEFKLDLGQDADVLLGDGRYAPTDLVAALLRTLREEAERLHGAPVTNALLTMPASYAVVDPRRDAMLAAADAAGLGIAELMFEPVAAALAPIVGTPFAAGDVVLVYDLGGGTFDTALVRIGTPAPEILGYASLDGFGGRDLDAALFQQVLAKLGGRPDPLEDTAITDPDVAIRARSDLVDLAVELKHQLSSGASAEEFTRDDQLVTLGRADLAGLAAPLIEATVACTRDLIRRVEIAVTEISGVVLVGGSTRSPVIAEAVTTALGLPVRQVEDPQHAVVRGATAWALGASSRDLAAVEPARDVTPLSWSVPGGWGTLVEATVREGEPYPADTALGRVRTAEGSLYRLRDPRAGRVLRWHAAPGDRVISGDWLVTADRAVTAPSGKAATTGKAAQVETPAKPTKTAAPARPAKSSAAYSAPAAAASWRRAATAPSEPIFSGDGGRLAYLAGSSEAVVITVGSGAVERSLRYKTGDLQRVALDRTGRVVYVLRDAVVTEFPVAGGPGSIVANDVRPDAFDYTFFGRRRDRSGVVAQVPGVVGRTKVSPLAKFGPGVLNAVAAGQTLKIAAAFFESHVRDSLASGEGRVQSLPAEPIGSPELRFDGTRVTVRASGIHFVRSGVRSPSLSADGLALAVVRDNQVQVWDTAEQELLQTVPATGAKHVALSLDGDWLAVATDGEVSMWEVYR